MRDYASVERARDAALAALGRIDILVNSAGITGPNVVTREYPLDAWRDVLDVNLTGTFHCARAVVEPMQAANYGRIVNIASVAGKEGNPNASAYSASKAGVIALTKSLGKELATTGIRVNCVTPAAVETPMFAQMTAEHIAYMKSKIPMNRFGRADEIAALVGLAVHGRMLVLHGRRRSTSQAAVLPISFYRGACFDRLSMTTKLTVIVTLSLSKGAPRSRYCGGR